MDTQENKLHGASFSLRNKPNCEGKRALYLKRFIDGSYVMKSTGIWLLPEHWNQKKQKVVRRIDADEINGKLDRIKAKDDKAPKKTKAAAKKQRHPLIEYAKEINDLYYSKQKYGYTAWYNKDKAIDAFGFFVRHFLGIQRLDMEDIETVHFDKYIAYRLNIRNNSSREGVNKTLVPLYEAVRYAAKTKIVPYKLAASICDNYILIKETSYNPEKITEDKVRYLTRDQMSRMKAFTDNLPPCKRKDVADMFFFSFYTCGMRASDIMTLEWGHVDLVRKVIHKTQFKTKTDSAVDIPISTEARIILLRWMEYDRNGRFVFDLLDKDFDFSDQRAVFMTRNARDKMLNRVLGELSRELGFERIIFHMARHTFAVMSLEQGMSVYMLSKLLGHSSITATEKTYAQYLKEKIDSEAKKILDIKL